jgi:hypothetical protein
MSLASTLASNQFSLALAPPRTVRAGASRPSNRPTAHPPPPPAKNKSDQILRHRQCADRFSPRAHAGGIKSRGARARSRSRLARRRVRSGQAASSPTSYRRCGERVKAAKAQREAAAAAESATAVASDDVPMIETAWFAPHDSHIARRTARDERDSRDSYRPLSFDRSRGAQSPPLAPPRLDARARLARQALLVGDALLSDGIGMLRTEGEVSRGR